MNKIAFLAAGVASGDRARARMRSNGCTPKGNALWTEQELKTLRQCYPDYQAAMRALEGLRSYASVRHQAQKMGLAPTRRRWTGDQLLRLRKVYRNGSTADIRDAFPDRDLKNIRNMARYFGIKRPRRPFVSSGILVIDQIRDRCFELRLSMVDLDEMAGTGTYFSHAGWKSGGINGKAVVRAVNALDGDLSVTWRPEYEEPPLPVALPQWRPALLAA